MSTATEMLNDSKKPLLLSLGLLAVCVIGLMLTKNSQSLSTIPSSTKKTYTQPQQVLEQGVD